MMAKKKLTLSPPPPRPESAPSPENFDASTKSTMPTDPEEDPSRSAVVVVPLDPSIVRRLVMTGTDGDGDDDSYENENERWRRRSNWFCRRYHVVCGCLCDVRRASIVANVVYAAAAVCFIVIVTAPTAMGLEDTYDDDRFNEMIDAMSAGTIPRNGIGLIAAPIGSYGAWTFRKWLVFAMTCWYGIYLVWAIVGSRYFSGVFAVLLLCPNLALFLALHNGRLTPENYDETGVCCGHRKKKKKTNTNDTNDTRRNNDDEDGVAAGDDP